MLRSRFAIYILRNLKEASQESRSSKRLGHTQFHGQAIAEHAEEGRFNGKKRESCPLDGITHTRLHW